MACQKKRINIQYKYLTDGWIRTADLCCWKWLLFQLSHNHCPSFINLRCSRHEKFCSIETARSCVTGAEGRKDTSHNSERKKLDLQITVDDLWIVTVRCHIFAAKLLSLSCKTYTLSLSFSLKESWSVSHTVSLSLSLSLSLIISIACSLSLLKSFVSFLQPFSFATFQCRIDFS